VGFFSITIEMKIFQGKPETRDQHTKKLDSMKLNSDQVSLETPI
jgi:hypothetical protein